MALYNLLYLENELMNWTDFLYIAIDAKKIIFGYTANHSLYLWLLSIRGPLQLYMSLFSLSIYVYAFYFSY